MRYRLYIDDSGNREYDEARNYTTSGKLRHFSYTGLLLSEPDASRLITKVQECKRAHFKTTNVELKSNWLRIPKERKKHYLDPFGISDTQLTTACDAFYTLIVEAPLELIGVVVDKLHMQEDYPVNTWYAPTAAYEVLMQRVVQAVPANAKVTVTIDEITGKTPRDNEYKSLLHQHHDQLRKTGGRLPVRVSFACLDGPIRFRHSHNKDLIQLADLAAYCVYRQFRDYPEEWEKPSGKTLPQYPYFDRINGKFRQGPNGRVQGYGIVKFPRRGRIPWKITKGGKSAAP